MTTGRTRTGASWGPSWRGSWAARPQEDRYLAAAVAAGRVFRPPTAVAQPVLRPAAYLAPRLLPSWRPAAYLTHRQTPATQPSWRPAAYLAPSPRLLQRQRQAASLRESCCGRLLVHFRHPKLKDQGQNGGVTSGQQEKKTNFFRERMVYGGDMMLFVMREI